MKFITLFSVLLFSITATAQDCSDAIILQKPGVWKETVSNSSGITPADLAKEKKVVAALHQMIKLKFTPKGVEANVNGGYSSPFSWMPGNDYAYSIIPRNYYCDGKSMKTAAETSTYFSIVANLFATEIYIKAEETADYAFMKDMPVAKDGYWVFNPIDEGLGFGMTGKLSMWLITYDGKLPYAYVTKKAFLEKRKLQLSKEMNEAGSGFKDVL